MEGGVAGATVGAAVGTVAGAWIGDTVSDLWGDLEDLIAPYSMAGKGKQKGRNWATEHAKSEAQSTGKDPCDILNEMYKNECDSKNKRDIKQAQKFLKCRRSRWNK